MLSQPKFTFDKYCLVYSRSLSSRVRRISVCTLAACQYWSGELGQILEFASILWMTAPPRHVQSHRASSRTASLVGG